MLGETAGFMLFVVAWLHWVGDASEIVCETKLDDYHRGHVVLGGDFHGEVQLRGRTRVQLHPLVIACMKGVLLKWTCKSLQHDNQEKQFLVTSHNCSLTICWIWTSSSSGNVSTQLEEEPPQDLPA